MKKTGLKIFLSIMLSAGLIISCGGTTSTSEQTPAPSTGTTSGSETPAANAGSGSASPTKYTLSGTITGGANAQGITVTVTATGYSGTATTDATGKYSLSDLSGATYTVTPTKTGMIFNPANLSVTDLATNKTDANFAAADIKNKTITSDLSPNMTLSICSDDDSTTYAGSSDDVGVTSPLNGCMLAEISRTYFKFDMADIATGSIIQSATLSFYQTEDVPVYSTNTLTIDHVNFGPTLDAGSTVVDWNSAIIGSSVTNTSNSEMVSVDAKAFVTSDCDAGRGYSEYRLSFPSTIVSGRIIVSQVAGKLPTLAVTYYKF